MARIRIELPAVFKFSASIPIRITDLNYGGHVGNDTILSIIHEARAQFLKSLGYSEKDFGGTGLIMADVVINFKSELFYGDVVNAAVSLVNISRASFDMVYLLKKGEISRHLAWQQPFSDYSRNKPYPFWLPPLQFHLSSVSIPYQTKPKRVWFVSTII